MLPLWRTPPDLSDVVKRASASVDPASLLRDANLTPLRDASAVLDDERYILARLEALGAMATRSDDLEAHFVSVVTRSLRARGALVRADAEPFAASLREALAPRF